MINLTNDCEDGMLSDDKPESPVDDEPNEHNYGGSSGGVVLKKGPWTSAEDSILIDYVKTHGEGNWNAVQKHSGLSRCGKSCRLRWANHLRPNLKKGSFTPQEELLIIELHAKMGNKWARMAAYLPGRTDNEIKNYWNTRIKRRQRAGLSIYPEEIRMKVLRERQNSDAINGGDKGPNDLLQSNGFVIPDVTFDGLKTNQNVMPYVPELPNISSSPYFSFMPPMMHRQKRLRESTALFSGFGGSIKNESLFDTSNNASEHYNWSFPVDPDPTTFGPLPGSHTLSNGNYSASESALGTVKLELPSLQYPEPEFGNWGTSPSLAPPLDNVDAFIQSPPPTCSVESPRHSGLLDALVHEAKSKNSAKVHSSEKCSSSSTPGDIAESSTPNVSKTEWENYGDPLSPLGHSVTSFFSDASADIAGTFLNPVPKEHLWTSDVQKETPTRDPMFGSTRSEHDSNYDNFDKDAIAAFLDEEMVWHYKTIMPETSSSSRQAWEFDSCTWNNMPGVCQMSEQP